MLGSNDWPDSVNDISSLHVSPTSENSLLPPSGRASPAKRVRSVSPLPAEQLSPHEAMVEDLHTVRGILEGQEIEYVLVRGVDSPTGTVRPTIAVNELDREIVVEALSRVHGLGIPVEFWSFDIANIQLPNANAVTRTILPRDEAKTTTVEMYGSTWPTLIGMWDRLADDIDFSVDIVFSWVDGTDLEWQRARAAKMQRYVVGEGDDHEARFRQINELKYALRSVHLFAPWIRNILIVTDSPRPEWLADHPRVRVVRSAEFFSDVGDLPTHNSHAVESQLHRIPGLSEHFIYSNDDMFFGRAVGPQGFFTSGGLSRFVESHTRIGFGETHPSRSGFENAARVNRALLREKFGRTISRNLEHSPAPLRRTVLEKLEAEFPQEFKRTASARFRSVTDISVTNSLYHYFALMTGYAVPHESLNVKYVDTTSREGIAALGPLLRDRDYDFFCLNDGSFPAVSAEERLTAVTAFLEAYFPIPAPWENAHANG